jgi:cyclopropane fatty-acyl-phospholipid synthase-like methyltransferase
MAIGFEWVVLATNMLIAKVFQFPIQIQNPIIMYTTIVTLNIYFQTYWVPLAYIAVFILHEVLNLGFGFTILSEEERVDTCYAFMDIYVPKEGNWLKNADLTEGYFKDDQTAITAEQAVQQKYQRFYELIGLKPGMKVLDMGCGYGQWMMFLRDHGVESVGVTLSQAHHRHCLKHHLQVRLADARHLPQDLIGQFDAVTALGSIEHMVKTSWTEAEINQAYQGLFLEAKKALSLTTNCGRFFYTVLNYTHPNLSLREKFYSYFLERHGSGRYPDLGQMEHQCQNFTMIYQSDQTEDYRYMSIINPDHFGNFRPKMGLRQVIYTVYSFLTDPYALHKWLYVFTNAWMWQLGGTSTQFDRHRPSATRLMWEMFEQPRE